MIRFWLVLLGLGIMTAEYSAAEEGTNRMNRLLAKLEKGEQVTIVAIGDSNTELTFHTHGHLNFCYLLQEALLEKYGGNKVIMIDSGSCGLGLVDALARLDRDVLRFKPDLVIIGYYDSDMDSMRKVIAMIRAAGETEILLRTPNPYVAPNMPAVTPPVVAGKEWPGTKIGETARMVRELGAELKIPVVDHYRLWLEADSTHQGPPSVNPNKLWMRMSDASHPGEWGHLAFYRDMAPFFGLPTKLSWEF